MRDSHVKTEAGSLPQTNFSNMTSRRRLIPGLVKDVAERGCCLLALVEIGRASCRERV